MNAPNFIFDSSAIRIVENKWERAQILVWLDAFPHQIQTLLIIMNSWFFPDAYWLIFSILIISILLLIKLFLKMYFFITFKNRRECSYHIEFEENNRIKQNLRLFFGNMFNMLDFSGNILIIIFCSSYMIDMRLTEVIPLNL